jgi:hypothetical protein
MCEGFPYSSPTLSSFESAFTHHDPETRLQSVLEMEDTVEHLKILLRQEELVYRPCKDYLSPLRAVADPSDAVSEGWRRKLCEWCYEVVDHFCFDREAVSIALNFLDRSVAERSESAPITRREFQLLAVTSLYMALKIHGQTENSEGPRRKLRIDAFVDLSRGVFQVDVIEAMERTILDSLSFRVNPPTCVRFVASYLSLFPKWTDVAYENPHSNVIGGIYDVARYLSELSVCVSSFAFTCNSSVIAYASILCAFEALQTSMPPPYQSRVIFQNNMVEATGLLPNDSDVLRVRAMLKDLAPNMFEGDDLPAEFLFDRQESSSSLDQELQRDNGKASPVCVVDSDQASPRSQRKRSRSTEESPPILHRSNF